MSKPATGSMIADLLLAMELGITPEEFNATKVAFEKQIEPQTKDTPEVKAAAIVYPTEPSKPPKND